MTGTQTISKVHRRRASQALIVCRNIDQKIIKKQNWTLLLWVHISCFFETFWNLHSVQRIRSWINSSKVMQIVFVEQYLEMHYAVLDSTAISVSKYFRWSNQIKCTYCWNSCKIVAPTALYASFSSPLEHLRSQAYVKGWLREAGVRL